MRASPLSLLAAVVFLLCLPLTAAGHVRDAVFAGSWYPGSEPALRAMVTDFLARVPESAVASAKAGRIIALAAPHAGYAFSGRVAACAYKPLEGQRFDTVIVIAPSHRLAFQGVSVFDLGGFRTPLGVMPLDEDFIRALKAKDDRVRSLPEAHAREHSLEIQLPFLQVVLPKARLVPLVMGEQDLATCRQLANSIAACAKGKSALIVASTDLSHFHPAREARLIDDLLLQSVRLFDPEGLHACMASGRCEACGGGPLVTAMLAARLLGANVAKVLAYADSGDATGDKSQVVGYLAAAFLSDPKAGPKASIETPPRIPFALAAAKAVETQAPTYSKLERTLLHMIARAAIAARFGGTPYAPADIPPALKEKRGVFVTLKIEGQLRGCIGRLVPDTPLHQAVADMAAAAAFNDWRFPQLTPREYDQLEYEISVLTPFRRIQGLEEITVGRHGLLLRRGFSQGLLLPQVATENRWDAKQFLEHTCLKAGLPADAWKDKGTEIYVFSAEIF